MGIADAYVRQHFGDQPFIALHVRPYPDMCMLVSWRLVVEMCGCVRVCFYSGAGHHGLGVTDSNPTVQHAGMAEAGPAGQPRITAGMLSEPQRVAQDRASLRQGRFG
jgi:hypothetical protein